MKRRTGPVISVIIALTALNLLVLAYLVGMNVPFEGSSSYGAIAENWLKGRYSLDGENYTFSRPPLYPALLALAQLLGGPDWSLVARLLQFLLSILCGLLVFLIVRDIGASNAVGYLSVSFYALHLSLLVEHYAQRETLLFELLLLLTVYTLIRNERVNYRDIVFIALLSAGLYLTRPTGIALLIVAILMIVLYERRSGRVSQYILSLLFLFTLFIAPWQYYNYRAFSKVTLSSSNTTGLNLYKGASPAVQAIYPQVDVDKAQFYIESQLREAGIDSKKNEYEADDFLATEARKYIVDNPGVYLRGMLSKFLAFYSPVITPLGKGDVVLEGNGLVVNNFSVNVGLTGFSHFAVTLVLVPLGFLGLLPGESTSTRDRKFRILVTLIFVLFTLLHLFSFAETRFRLPLDGLLFISAGLLLDGEPVRAVSQLSHAASFYKRQLNARLPR